MLREESPERDLREEKKIYILLGQSLVIAVIVGGAGIFAKSVFIVRPGDRGDGKIGEIKVTGAPRVPS